jgi:hypothetical protein
MDLGSNPACKMPRCEGLHAESLHNILVGSTSLVNTVNCDEDDEEDGCVNMAKGEYVYDDNNG